MKLSVAVAASGLLAVAAAQMSGLPDCAKTCALDSVPDECGSDPECICSSKSFIESISCCVSKSCSEDDQEKSLEFAQKMCKPAGVDNLPKSASCDSDDESDGAVHGTAVSTGTKDATDGVVHGTAVSTGVAETTDGVVHGTAVSTGVASTKDGGSQSEPTDAPTGTASTTGADPASTTGAAAALVVQNGAVAAAAAAFALAI